jgi:hypothetical protein
MRSHACRSLQLFGLPVFDIESGQLGHTHAVQGKVSGHAISHWSSHAVGMEPFLDENFKGVRSFAGIGETPLAITALRSSAGGHG